MDVTAEDEIRQISVGKPHVVILGAGASYAAFPQGDKHGRRLPLMNNLIETLGIEDIVAKTGLRFESLNFEDIYASIHQYPGLIEIRDELERQVYRYFRGMELPEHPTIYDHLVLSLRDKDLIATFNWDPFLVQAVRRNSHRFKLPRVLFLHGNVEVGYCTEGHMMGNKGGICSRCGSQLAPTRLLYPVTQKNYHLDEFISRQWAMVTDALKHAFMVTIFGYGAPTSDVRAIELLKCAWGSTEERCMEQFEIIDIRDEEDLRETWSPFIHSHHDDVSSDFYESWIAHHPRRTGEAFLNQYMEGKFIENNPLPKEAGFAELWDWYSRLQEIEDAEPS
jgi:hypothetical protein